MDLFNNNSGARIVARSAGRFLLTLTIPAALAACGGGVGDASTSSSANTSALGSNAVSLAWDPSATAGVSGYRIYYGAAPGAYEQTQGEGINVGNLTTYTLLGLSGGNRYYFSVTAFDAAGNESAYSNETFRDIP